VISNDNNKLIIIQTRIINEVILIIIQVLVIYPKARIDSCGLGVWCSDPKSPGFLCCTLSSPSNGHKGRALGELN
jgi:hypothetical protein